MEKRYALSVRQYEAIAEAQAAVDASQAAYQAAVRHANQVGTLIRDFLGIPDSADVQDVDPKTRELIVVLPDPAPSA